MADDTHSPTTHPRQESALRALREHVSLSIRDLATEVAAAEADDPTEVAAADLDPVERTLRRRHVPELEERSYVRYDEAREVVSLLGRGADAAVEFSADPDHTVDLETADPATVSVDLDEATLESLHDAMRRETGLDSEMSYDEVIRRLAED